MSNRLFPAHLITLDDQCAFAQHLRLLKSQLSGAFDRTHAATLRRTMPHTQFKTPDPALTGYLFARGFEINTVERAATQVAFVFDLTPDVRVAIENYSFNAPVPCRDLIGGYRKALGLIRSARRGNNSDNSIIQGAQAHASNNSAR
jgi:hypothetical protein